MKHPIVVQDFKQLSYALKAGHAPVEKEKPKHKGSWSIYYGKLLVEPNIKFYGDCVNKIKVYKRFGHIYPKPELFNIQPFNNKK